MYTIIKSREMFFLWINGTSKNTYSHLTFSTKREATKFCKANNLNFK